MLRVLAAFVVLICAISAFSAEKASPLLGSQANTCRAATMTLAKTTLMSVVSVAQGDACSQCANRCEGETQDCKNGSIKSCYLAAACLCQCNLDAGGCGSSKEALQQCVDGNQKAARDLE
ncbi:MAG: hypothetical protein HY648_06320 [Acidobacteria bacterium]|nr:hypothetical protein [Acidobacteriota bacterium]